eukprot:2502773-Prymnesium_polylepis.1
MWSSGGMGRATLLPSKTLALFLANGVRNILAAAPRLIRNSLIGEPDDEPAAFDGRIKKYSD